MNAFFDREIILENKFVKLVPLSEQYTYALRTIIFDKEITQYTGNHIVDDHDLEKYIRSALANRQEKQTYPFIVIDKLTSQVAGMTRFGNIIFHNKRLEIGWTWYGKPFRGTHVNLAAKFELLRFAFEEMMFNRVQFSVDADNLRSQKAVLKLGATQEGYFRSNYVDASGNCRDDIYYSIIRSEWLVLQRTVFSQFNNRPAAQQP
ncbi:ribosomal protein N-acetylase-like protein [Paenibacillus curdlanolyticus YK9]|uniref:Ribosomal protein N-acetylase-like protein n=1 Tax=Paenibacillus curdlanolyticus YK9 TaxID=717606 RepID=E0IA55_9BACL|nr:GNAT family protein [Paenibacillus curdlanolyticus]EFM10632.1 ribosomal protein N-acetylase-like protein [Paenibacillus curdlanolyticus YK9]